MSKINGNPATEEKEVQTVVRVFPFILEATDTRASARSEKKFCTVLSLDKSKENKAFYNLLQYCPFHEIQKDSIRVIDLPRKTKLTFLGNTRFSPDELRILTLADDDGVAECCVDMLARMITGRLTTYKEAETQTSVMVRPYLLEEPRVAKIFYSTGIQVSTPSCTGRK